MERDRVLAWMKQRGLNNRSLAHMLGISEDKVSKSLTDNGKPRQWQGTEVLKLIELMNSEEPMVKTEVRGTGMTADQARDAWAMRLIKRSASFLELRQFNPDRTFRLPIAQVQHLHRVRGRL
jgi:predicted XRE-type DNA-binding protein